MKKANYILLSILGLLILSTSCGKKKTYADLLKEEKKAIDKFISSNQLRILKKFPTDGKFDDKDFYLDPATGVYYNIISVGDTINAPRIKKGDEFYPRYSGLRYFSTTNDTTEYNNLNGISYMPMKYYGPVNRDSRTLYLNSNPGLAVPLEHIGHLGRVKMIIPFTWGSKGDRGAYTPTYYNDIEYRWYN